MRYAIDGRCIQDHFPGVARYTLNLVRALAEVAPEDEFLLLYDPSARSTRYSLEVLRRQANLRLVPGEAPVFSLSEQWRIPRQLRGLRPALIHAPYYLRPYALPAPVVLTAYDLIPLIYPRYFTLKERAIFRLAMGLALRTAQAVIAISQATASDLQRHYRLPPARLAVIALAADPAFGPQPMEAIATIRQKYQLPERYALYLGSNKPHKNLVRLVEAWKEVVGCGLCATGYGGEVAGCSTPCPVRTAHDASRAMLVIAGHWDERYPEARERAAALGLGGSVRFLGAVAEEHLPALYAGAELFVFPSLYEGFGLPVLEALACGVPVVCSNSSSLPEVAGDAALLVDPLDVPAMAQALGRVLGDLSLRQDLRARSLARAALFSWERTARETLAVYRKMQ